MIEISALHIYPLKGGRGIAVDDVVLDRFGPRGDRRWLVVDGDGAMITQREIPRLGQIAATPVPGGLELAAPGLDPVTIPTPNGQAPLSVQVWDDVVQGRAAGPEADRWCSEALGATARLVYCPDDSDRRTDPDYDPIGAPVSFADGYPILLVGEASLAELNRRLADPLPMNRFRPNVVVRGTEPFAEDGWKRFRAGGVPFDAVKPCARCTVTTTDQVTGARGVEPLRTMATFRKRGSGVMFGMNVVHRAAGQLRVGDPITLER
jgi:uncharacterized protein YcbX